MEIVELTEDSQFLEPFYELYQKIFVNENERESKENIKKYLSLKNTGFYHGNSYHIFCSVEDSNVTGILVGDYYTEPNAGVIEFVAVDPAFRIRNTARGLIDFFIKAIINDASREINGIFCEVDIMEIMVSRNVSLTSLPFWSRLGFRVVEVDYVQPALSPGKKPVKDLILIYKDLSGKGLPSYEMLSFARCYMKYAMSIDNPSERQEYKLIEEQAAHRNFFNLLRVNEFLKTGLCSFSNPAVDYISTFPLVSLSGLREANVELSPPMAYEIASKLLSEVGSYELFEKTSIEVQKGDGTPLQVLGEEDYILAMRQKREKYVSGDYLKSKISIKGNFIVRKETTIDVVLTTGKASTSEILCWLDVDHLGMASFHIIGFFQGRYSTREVVSLTDSGKVLINNNGVTRQFNDFALSITERLQRVGSMNLGSLRRVEPEIYPISFSSLDRDFRKVKAHIYALTNQDLAYDYASEKYITKFFEEDQSAVDTVFCHYGRKVGSVIFSENYSLIFEAVTGYKEDEIDCADPVERMKRISITVLNEYISEVTALLHERLYLKRLQFILSQGDVSLIGNEKKTLRYLADVERLFYAGLEEFRGLSLYSYTELDYALKQARSDMGIKEELEATMSGIGSLSKKAELLYRIRNDSNNVLLSYLLTLFTATALTVSLINFVLPRAAPIAEKIIFIFFPPVLAIIILYTLTMGHRKYSR